ncbi:MAG: transcriptional repressor [Candidatus Krumholzibacteriota bacterium]|nr:transcriptional repressor [Candidatus Krumholzibacteriota bacterium]
MTKQRKMILDELRQVTVHPTADQVYESVRKKMPGISLGTVYRNLDLLCRTGMARRIEKSGSPMRYDGDLSLHNHICCTKCGRVDDIRAIDLETGLEEKEIMKTGYRLIKIKIELAGLCPECQKSEDRLEPKGLG